MNLFNPLPVSLYLSALLVALSASANSSTKQIAERSSNSVKARKNVQLSNNAGEFANFSQWKEVSNFIDHMVSTHGFERDQLDAIFKKARHVETTIQLIKPAPPNRPKNWTAYRSRFVEPARINAGVAFWNTHADTLARVEKQYGVPAEIIIGILGVETIYGRNTGSFRVLDALTTLAFDYPDTPTRQARMEFFRSELENTLLYTRETDIDPFSLLGSYAGAIGLPQFMPGSIRKYAVDFDGNGKIDLRTSPADAIGSIANFLIEHGWKPGEPIAFPVTVSESENSRGWNMFIGQALEAKFKLDELKAAGVIPKIEPPADMGYGLIDLQNGTEPTEYWLGARNFFAITHYNRSFFYAMSVVDLGRAVRSAREHWRMQAIPDHLINKEQY